MRIERGSYFSTVQGNLPQKIPISTTRTTRCGRTIAAPRSLVPHFDKVFPNLRQQLKRKPEDKMEGFDMNTQQAAVHLGNDILEN